MKHSTSQLQIYPLALIWYEKPVSFSIAYLLTKFDLIKQLCNVSVLAVAQRLKFGLQYNIGQRKQNLVAEGSTIF